MKKILAALTACTVFAALLAAVGCSGEETFEAKRYSSGEDSVKSVSIDVTDREVEIITSTDGQVHIDYSESEQEFYSLLLSEDGDLTMTLETDKDWTDFIGTKPAAQYRKITLAVPSGLSDLTIKTTNETIGITSLTVQNAVMLDCNGGNIAFELLGVEKVWTSRRRTEVSRGTSSAAGMIFPLPARSKRARAICPSARRAEKKR